MQKQEFRTVQEYLDQTPEPQRQEIERLMDITRKEVPEAEESISYQMPAFKLNGKPLVYFGAFKNHISIFPTPGPIEELDHKLKPHTKGKGTLQFKLNEPCPEDLLIKVIRGRLKQLT